MHSILTTLLCVPLLCIQLMVIPMNTPDFDDYTNPDTEYQAIIEDDADVLSDFYEYKLTGALQLFTDYGNIAIASVNSHSNTTKEYAEEHYTSLFGESTDGILLLFDEGNDEVYIHPNGKMTSMISVEELIVIHYDTLELVSHSDYFSACRNTLWDIMDILKTYATTDNAYLNPTTGYRVTLSDSACLLSDEERTNLVKLMEPITNYGNVAFVTVNSTSFNTEDTARNYYSQHFGTDSGTLFLIDMDNRYIWIHSDGQVYKTITTSYANTITDNAYSLATDGKYYECAKKVFGQILTLLDGGKISQPMKYICNIILGLIIAVSINFGWMACCAYIKRPKHKEMLSYINHSFTYTNPRFKYTHNKRERRSSSSGGRHGGSGGFGGGGGGRSGGGGGHRF